MAEYQARHILDEKPEKCQFPKILVENIGKNGISGNNNLHPMQDKVNQKPPKES